MNTRDLTPEEAIEYALDPRNDAPGGFHVMAQNYDPDCPNHDDHEIVDGAEVCRCWDGITPDDVGTWTENDKVDVAGFAEWGPFQLWYEDDPGQARRPTPTEALDSFINYMLTLDDFAKGRRPDLNRAMDVLQQHFQSEAENPFDEELDPDKHGRCFRDFEEDTEDRPRDEEGRPIYGHVVSANLCEFCLEYI